MPALVVSSCEKYSDLHRPFFAFLDRFWPDLPFETVLVTDTPGYELGFATAHPVRIVSTGYGKPWCRMLCEGLEASGTDTAMLMMDDYFLDRPVATPAILARLEEFRRHNALNLRLSPNPPPQRQFAPGLMEYEKNTAYSISCQTGFWDVRFLMSLALKFQSAWEFERKGSYAVDPTEKRPILAVPEREFFYLDSVHKGYWEKPAIALAAANGIELDFARRTLPPWRIRAKEAVKKAIFHTVPRELLLRIQNRLG